MTFGTERGTPGRFTEIPLMARRLSDVGVLVLVLLLAAVLSGHQAGSSEVRIDFTAKGVTQNHAFENIVEQADLEVVGTFRGDEHYRYDFSLSDMMVADALDGIYVDRGWKLQRNVLVLTPVRSEYPEWCRFEILLEHAPVQDLLPELRSAFPDIEFTEHPTMNGFFPLGSKESLLELKRMIYKLDIETAPPFPPITRRHELQILNPERAVDELTSRFPKVQVGAEGRTLQLNGSLREVGEVLTYLDTVDRLYEETEISLSQVAGSAQTCFFYTANNVDLRVDCPSDCQGPLQRMGLQDGDLIFSQHVRSLADQPEWRITRNGVPTRIVLNLNP